MNLSKRIHNFTAILVGLLLATSSLCAVSSRHVDVPGMPEPTLLNGEWKFHLAADEKAADEYRWFFEECFDVSAWDTIKVPSNWNMEGFEEPHYVNGTKSEGFYVRTFEAPAEGEVKRRVLLHFEGSWMSTEAWLNGQRLGRHESGFTGFSFDISDEIRWGEANTLAVRVRQQVEPNLFKFDVNDDWGLAGIYRDVWIEYTPRIHVMANVTVETDFDEYYDDATLSARVFIERWYEGSPFFEYSEPLHLKMTLKTLTGDVVQEKKETVRIRGWHQGNDFTLAMEVEDPLPWTAETPNLYELEITLTTEGELVDRWVDNIGFREVSTEGGVFRINGQEVKLRGVARHDQWPEVGRATREEHWIRDIELMKAANINAVRTAHYPPNEGFVRLCDEYGLYVIEEIPLGFGGDRMWEPSFAEGMMLRIYETMYRDMNRPSVVVWSFGNEDPFCALHLVGLKMIKGLDQTRPTLMPYRAEYELPKEVDIYAPHYWSTADYDLLGAESTRPIVTTETTHALGPDDFGEFDRRWKALTIHPTGAGAMIWLWADQGLKRTIAVEEALHPMKDKDSYTREGAEFVADKVIDETTILDSHGSLGTDGIVDADREPQRDYWEAKAVYAPVEILDEWMPLPTNFDAVGIRVYNGFDFLDLSTVTLEWKLFRDGTELDSGTETLEGAPHTTQRLYLPLESVDRSADGALYAHISIKREDGSVMNTASVRLGHGTTPRPAAMSGETARLVEDGDTLRLKVGAAEYHFKNGVIEKAKMAGDDIIEDSDIVVWRPSTYSERNQLDKIEGAPDWETFLQGVKPTLLDSATEQLEGAVVYHSTVEYRVDEENFVKVEYIYTLHDDGRFELAYEATPTISYVDWIPEIGVALKVADEPLNAAWLGEGVGSSMPGKTAATVFGLWDVALFSFEARGTKYHSEWVKVYDDRGWGLWAEGMDGFRFVGVNGKGSTLRLLSRVAGSWTKNGPAELSEWNLPINDGQTYVGSFTLTLLSPRELTFEEKSAVLPDPAVVESSFINPNPPYRSCHASTIAQTSEGGLVAAWFGGTRERHPDVGIWVGRYEDGEWQEAVEVANGEWTDGNRYPTWNPVLFQPSNGPLQLFYKIGPSPSEWWGMVMTSSDGGRTWSESEQLPEGFLGPIKNKPVELADGSWFSPSSTEGNGWHVHFERSSDQGETWEMVGPVEHNGIDSIQPSVLFHDDGRLQALCRTRSGFVSTTWSYDGGRTWTPMTRTNLPNPGSGTDAVTLADGRQLLVYNHSTPPTERPHKGVRYPLDLAISHDGVNWDRVLTIESAPRGAGYAYPAIIQAADGLVHITYTWDRDRIKHVVIDPAKL
jgi:beta-galactosidase